MVVNVLGHANKKLKKYANDVAVAVLNLLEETAELSIKFVSPREIKRLNNQFRNINKVTDVLSFPATNTIAGQKVDKNEEYLGDMAICIRRAKKQAKEYSVNLYAEVKKLIIHSILHLVGYDHIKDEDFLVMSQKEEQISKAVGL